MENKNITLILVIVIVIALVVFVSTKVFNNENSVQESSQESSQESLNENEQEINAVPGYDLDPRIKRSSEIRSSSMNTASGSLGQVGNDHFSLGLRILKDADFDHSSGEEPEFDYEYIDIKISENTEIVDMNDFSYFTIPENINGAIDTLKYLYENYADDYDIYIFAAYPEGEERISSYIEWSVSPK